MRRTFPYPSPTSRPRLLLALAAGAVTPIAFAPFGVWGLALLTPALLYLLWRGTTPRRALLLGWLFGVGQFGVGVSWVYYSIHHFGNAPLAVALLLAALLILYMALFPALVGYLCRRLPATNEGVRLLLLFPALWTLGEWLRGWFLTGFPWLNLGYSQIDAPLGGLAPVAGVYGITLAVLLTSALGLWLTTGVARQRGTGATLLGGLSLAALWGAAVAAGGHPWSTPAGAPVSVALLQGNVPQDAKWEVTAREHTLALYRGMTREAGDARVVIWPETAVPAFAHWVEPFLGEEEAEARVRGQELLIGIPYKEPDSPRYFNTILRLGGERALYHKRHLVPFGEFLPFKGLLSPLLRVLRIPMSDFSPGAEEAVVVEAGGYPAGLSICYEAAFGEEIIDALPHAAWLVNVTNDAWFGDTLARYQHLEMARMRARETARWMARATNDGISALIDERGALRAVTPARVRATLRGEITPQAGETPYVSWGNTPALLLALLLGGGSFLRRKPCGQASVS